MPHVHQFLGTKGRPPSSTERCLFSFKRHINETWQGLEGRWEIFLVPFLIFFFRVMFFTLNRFIICRSLYLFL